MTLIPSKELRFFELGAENLGHAKFTHREKVTADKTSTALEKIKAFAKKGADGRRSQGKPQHAPTELSIEVDDLDTTYVVRIDPEVRTSFGPGSYPVMILPLQVGRGLLSDVGLITGDGTFIPAKEISDDYRLVPKDAALTFRCDLAKLKAAWKQSVDPEHQDKKMELPIYLNLYDTETKGPVWTFEDDHTHVQAVGGANPKKDRTHGGIHPGGAAQYLYEYP